mgnify:CR=1 FL=1
MPEAFIVDAVRTPVGKRNGVLSKFRADYRLAVALKELVERATVAMPSSKVKIAIAKVLKDEGYIDGFKVGGEEAKPQLEIALRYYAGRPVI